MFIVKVHVFNYLKRRIKQDLRMRVKREVIAIVQDVFFRDSYAVESFEHCHFERNSFIRLIGDVKLGENFAVGQFSKILVNENVVLITGDHSWIADNCYIELGTGCKIIIGQRTSLQSRCQIRGDVTIGDDVLIAPNCFRSSGKHIYDYIPELKIREQDRKYFEDHGIYSNPIKIGSYVWLGINSIIFPGVTVGDGSMVGANAVVSKDVEPHTVVGGVPAKFIKSRI